MDDYKPEYILNFAALAYATSWYDSHRYYDTNITAVAKVAEALYEKKFLKQFLQIGSSEIYGATKAGINQITKYFAVHLSNKNIRVNSISPGGIYNLKNPQDKKFIKKYSSRNPMKRMAKIQEIVGAAIYLASDASTYTNGHNLVVDGGMSSW